MAQGAEPCRWPACVIGKNEPFPPLADLLNLPACYRCEKPEVITVDAQAPPEGA